MVFGHCRAINLICTSEFGGTGERPSEEEEGALNYRSNIRGYADREPG